MEKILSKSQIPPIIIIQGDHGTALNTNLDNVSEDQFHIRMDILNAYYLPDGGDKVLYQLITPVNSFRKIFNFYFGTNYETLEDISYYSDYSSYFKFITNPGE